MTDVANSQWLRKASLVLVSGEKGLDLSELHFKFTVQQGDVQSPNSADIRVYNLSSSTQQKVQKEYSRVILQAGYENGAFGVIFDGTVKQFRRGRENATDTYLDILAADADVGYNFGVCNSTLAAGSTPAQRIATVSAAMGVTPGPIAPYTGGILPRGKVLFGMARARMRDCAASQFATWSVQNGRLQMVALDSYLPGEAVVLNSFTGLIGIPEQTENGISARCLLNPKVRIGGLVKIDNVTINTTIQRDPNAAPVPFNQYTGLQLLADISADGVYRLYVAEFRGDTRGADWYTDMVMLSVNQATKTVKPYG